MGIKLLTLCLLTAVSCSTNEKEPGSITINAVKALENREDLKLSQIVDRIEYIPPGINSGSSCYKRSDNSDH